MVAFLDQAHVDAAFSALADAQHAVFDLSQVRAHGLSSAAARKRVAIGRWHRIHRAVYSLVPAPLLTAHGRWMAAVLACGRGAVLSHHSAGSLHGIRRTSRTRIDVTISHRSSRRHAGIVVHRSLTLTPADVTIVDAIPCTTVARTLLDMADDLAARQLERAFDQAEAETKLDLVAVKGQLARNPTRLGARKLKAILSDYRIGSTVTESELEERLLPLLRATGCPMPDTQVWIDPGDGQGMLRRDFVWRALKLNVETDGGRHRTRLQMETDTRHDQRLIDAGWTVIRITWKQLHEEPERVIATILRALRRAGATW
jgi:hypothetical protein